MANPVRCDVCGKLFSSSYVKSHKRLAHSREQVASADGQAGMKTILELYKNLSDADKQRVLAKLAPREQESP